MTQNQIAYLQAIETNRANVAKEQETKRNNLAALEETVRSHRADEQERNRYNTLYLAELTRSNREKEAYNLLNLQEQQRHNIASENLSDYATRVEKYKADNALYLGLGNLSTTKEYNYYQNQLAQERYNTQKQTTAKEKRSVELIGSQIRQNDAYTDLLREQSKSESSLRTSKKFSNYAGPIVQGLRSLSPIVHLFTGGS